MSTDQYVAPVTQELSAKVEEKTPAVAEKAVAPTATPSPAAKPAGLQTSTPKEPSLIPVEDVISVAKMVNAKATEVTAVMVDRIDRHFKYLSGELGFADVAARHQEQVTFIETIGNSLQADFEVYVLVTDHLLTKIRENITLFNSGEAFRFVQGLDKGYPISTIRVYKLYIELLTKIAGNWKYRYKLKKLMDPATVMADLPPKGRVNLNQYFNKLASA